MITLAKINEAEGKQWVGQSTDDKTTVNAESGVNDIFFELDTGIFYYFDGTEWQVIPSGSGGGGTPTVNATGAYGEATASAQVGEGTPVTKTIPMGGVWCEMTTSGSNLLFEPFAHSAGFPPAAVVNADNSSCWIGGFAHSFDGAVDDKDRLYIYGSILHVDANETLGTPEGVLFRASRDSNGYVVYSNYEEDVPLYAEARFTVLEDQAGHPRALKFASAAMGTAPDATQDITDYFSLLNPKMLFFCQGVEEIGE